MKTIYRPLFFLLLRACLFVACDDFIKIDPPRTDLVKETVFGDEATAESAIADIYLSLQSTGFASGGPSSISMLASLSSDEQRFHSTRSATEYLQFNNNELRPDNLFLNTLWSGMYSAIYKSNTALEGLPTSTGISPEVRDRLTGEAKFIRAFCHFYLVNLWGDVPLVLSSDYKANNVVLRAPSAEVYQQIVLDLKDAVELLPDDYGHSNNERVRANSWVATAFLARVHLYMQDWERAEAEATKVIESTSLFSLEPVLRSVFRGTSPEAIFQLWSDSYPSDRSTFTVLSSGPLFGTLRPEYVTVFEPGDQRWQVWGRTRVINNVTYHYTLKYLDFSFPPLDYTTVMRLAEQFLIRAEARVHLGKLPEAAADINKVRARAGLANTTSITEAELINDIIAERQAEFFTEWGHRWFDLKRWGLAEQVLAPLKPGWSSADVLFPIPEIQIINNPAITQNPN